LLDREDAERGERTAVQQSVRDQQAEHPVDGDAEQPPAESGHRTGPVLRAAEALPRVSGGSRRAAAGAMKPRGHVPAWHHRSRLTSAPRTLRARAGSTPDIRGNPP